MVLVVAVRDAIEFDQHVIAGMDRGIVIHLQDFLRALGAADAVVSPCMAFMRESRTLQFDLDGESLTFTLHRKLYPGALDDALARVCSRLAPDRTEGRLLRAFPAADGIAISARLRPRDDSAALDATYRLANRILDALGGPA
jgi:hypothetical protein